MLQTVGKKSKTPSNQETPLNINETMSQKETKTLHLKIRTQVLEVMIARTPEQQKRGLCCRNALPENQGMLFIYDQPRADNKFWMKDTLIPLDMFWLDSDKKIIYIEKSVQPQPGVSDAELKTYGPELASQYVLETNAGFANKHNIQIGDQVEF